MKWYDTVLTKPPRTEQPVSVPVIEKPVTTPTVAPTVVPEIRAQEPTPDFEREAMYAANGATRSERWCIEESFKEKGITPDLNLAWMWLNKLRQKERL